jgi:hypothetical protein
MTTQFRSFLCKAAICALLVIPTESAQADTPIGGVTKSDAAWIVVAIVAIGAGIGIGIYAGFHHGRSLKGCAVSGPNGLELENRSDGQTYALAGEVADVKPGDRVRVSGKKEKTGSGGVQHFVVEKLTKDYGACVAATAAH